MKNLSETIKHFASFYKKNSAKNSAEWVPSSVKIKIPCLEGSEPKYFVMAGYKCTHCGHENLLSVSNYCPNCGFSMSRDNIEIE